MKVTDLTAQLAQPLVEAAGCTLWDVEYIREGGTWYLRVFIDAPEGVNIDQCEAVSRPLSDALDEADPIQGSYVLEVGSAGADRALKKPEHFAQCMGQEVDVKLYRPREGRKEFTGTLAGYDQGNVTVTQPHGAEVVFEKKEIALVRLHLDFEYNIEGTPSVSSADSSPWEGEPSVGAQAAPSQMGGAGRKKNHHLKGV